MSERPKLINRNSDGLLHSEDGPAVEWRDSWKNWFIGGVSVDEQIVMNPNSQTVSQIDTEENGDVKSIRIERFGWSRYLKESGATVIDSRQNEIENTHEALCRTKDGNMRLMATCPSGKQVCLGLPPTGIESCQQAQAWLAGVFGDRQCVGRT